METLCRCCACLAAPLALVLGNMDAPQHSVAEAYTLQPLTSVTQPN
ncbi:hypothetical protein [Mycobacterium sp. ACS4054]|nr:hypothetical protein [Mycobacterium sp. ACS4054]